MYVDAENSPFHVKLNHLQKIKKNNKPKNLRIKKTKICQQTVRHKCAFGLDTWPGFPYCP